MSVQRYETADGTRYRVRWRDHTGRMRSATRRSKRTADALDADIKAKKFSGDALPSTTKDTLASAFADWERLRAPELATATQKVYAAAWKKHIAERDFGSVRLVELTSNPILLEEIVADMRERKVGAAAQRKTLVVLSAVLTACVRWKKIATNPLRQMPKPTAERRRTPYPFPPLVVERIRVRMLRRRRHGETDPRADACLVGLMAYAGLRPGEALALTWADVGTHSLNIDKAIAYGEVRATKTGRSRSVPLSAWLAEDLAPWHVIRGEPPSQTLLFPGPDGAPWTRTHLNNWRTRVWKPVVQNLAKDPALDRLATAVPYDCRGSFVSMHLRAGASPLEVARWAGHSPAVMFGRYAGVIDELVGEPILPVDEQIERARRIVERRSALELDRMTAEILERPTVRAAGSKGAAKALYETAD